MANMRLSPWHQQTGTSTSMKYFPNNTMDNTPPPTMFDADFLHNGESENAERGVFPKPHSLTELFPKA